MLETPPHLYYPLMLDLRGRRVLVVGGGVVARRKVEGLCQAGAAVTVVAPHVHPMPEGVTVLARPFVPDDLAGAWFVIAATDDRDVNATVAHEAEARGLWVNVVDDPDYCSAILPAVVRRGALCVAVSTGGGSPLLARRLRERLQETYGPEYGELVDLLRHLRRTWEPRAAAAGLSAPRRRCAWEHVLDLPLLDLLRGGDRAGAEQLAGAALEAALAEAPVR